MDELRSVLRAGTQTDPDHRWLQPLRSALDYMESGVDLEFASKDYLRYLWVEENARKIHLDKVRRLTLEDLLTVGFLVVGVSTSVYFFATLQGGIRDGEEFALKVLLVVTASPYLIRVLIGLYWEKVKGIRMSHFFTPEGGLICFALDWLQVRRRK